MYIHVYTSLVEYWLIGWNQVDTFILIDVAGPATALFSIQSAQYSQFFWKYFHVNSYVFLKILFTELEFKNLSPATGLHCSLDNFLDAKRMYIISYLIYLHSYIAQK